MEDEVEYAKRRSKRNRKRCIIGLSILLVLLLIIAIIVVITLLVVPLLHDEKKSGAFRLPTSVVPDQYDLEIQPYLIPGNFTFDGRVNITVTCLKSTDNITLHSSGLTIHEATVKDVTKGSNLVVKKTETVSEYELLILHLKDKLKADKMYQLEFKFSGTMGTSEGFYWRSYRPTEERGIEKYIAATKFKPSYARRAFPCFDEPAYKAVFAITIVRQEGLSSFSSGGEKKEKPREDGWKADVYSPSIKMSTHLVAFFIGDFKTIVSKPNASVVARAESIKESEYALEITQNAKEFYSSKLRLPLNIPRIDLVAIPDEIDAGNVKQNRSDAMGQESTSWGLIMMDESSMSCLPERTEEWKKQEVARKVAHQVAHQLFGILVTPKWWNELWLSESIATYLGTLAIDNKINQKWKMLDALKRSSSYVEFDCSESSQPLSMAVNDPSDISKSFNLALYRKGARLIDMARGLITDKLFWQGLTRFLQDKAFNVAESNDLWRHLTEIQSDDKNRIDFEAKMRSWIHNRGHPIVTLTRNYEQKTGFLSQKSCLNESTLWEIPITFFEGNGARAQAETIWLNTINKTLLAIPEKRRWVLLNGQLNGYFHVNYDMENWKRLSTQLEDEFTVIPSSARYQLLYDALLLAKKNHTSYDVLLGLLLYMRFEQDMNMKEFLAEAKLSEIWKMLRMSNVDLLWKDYLHRVIGTTYSELFQSASEKEDLLPRIYLKREIATSECYYYKPKCVNDAIDKSKKWLAEKKPFKEMTELDHYLIRPYLCTAVRKEVSIADEIYDCLKNKSKACDYLQNKTKISDMMYALGCSDTDYRSSNYMATFIIENGDPSSFIESKLNSHNGSLHLFDYLKSNLNRLKKDYDRLELVVKSLSEAIANPKELEKMNEVFDTFIDELNKEDSGKEAKRISKMFDSYAKKAAKRLELVKYQLPSMVHWLKKYKPNH